MWIELEGIFNDFIFLVDLDSVLLEGFVCEFNFVGCCWVVILVIKEVYCLGDLLMKVNYGGLDVEIVVVIGNYEMLCLLVECFEIFFELVSYEGLMCEEYDMKMVDVIDVN